MWWSRLHISTIMQFFKPLFCVIPTLNIIFFRIHTMFKWKGSEREVAVSVSTSLWNNCSSEFRESMYVSSSIVPISHQSSMSFIIGRLICFGTWFIWIDFMTNTCVCMSIYNKYPRAYTHSHARSSRSLSPSCSRFSGSLSANHQPIISNLLKLIEIGNNK